MKSINSLINNIKNRISNNDSVKKIEEATNKILHKEDKEVSCCNNTDNKNIEKVEELNKIKIVQPSSSSIFNRSDDIYHLFRPQDNINSYDSSLIMRNVDKCKGTNENIKNSKRIQLYKNKGDISNFNTTIRTNLDKFKIDLSKDLRYKFLNKYGAEDDFNFDIYIFPPPPGTIPSGYYQIPGDITKWRTRCVCEPYLYKEPKPKKGWDLRIVGHSLTWFNTLEYNPKLGTITTPITRYCNNIELFGEIYGVSIFSPLMSTCTNLSICDYNYGGDNIVRPDPQYGLEPGNVITYIDKNGTRRIYDINNIWYDETPKVNLSIYNSGFVQDVVNYINNIINTRPLFTGSSNKYGYIYE